MIQTQLQLSSHLRALRKARGLSQAAFGRALGVGQTRVARIEGDPTAISVGQLIEVLAVLGVRLVLRDAAPPLPADTPENAPKTGGTSKRRPARHSPDSDW